MSTLAQPAQIFQSSFQHSSEGSLTSDSEFSSEEDLYEIDNSSKGIIKSSSIMARSDYGDYTQLPKTEIYRLLDQEQSKEKSRDKDKDIYRLLDNEHREQEVMILEDYNRQGQDLNYRKMNQQVLTGSTVSVSHHIQTGICQTAQVSAQGMQQQSISGVEDLHRSSNTQYQTAQVSAQRMQQQSMSEVEDPQRSSNTQRHQTSDSTPLHPSDYLFDQRKLSYLVDNQANLSVSQQCAQFPSQKPSTTPWRVPPPIPMQSPTWIQHSCSKSDGQRKALTRATVMYADEHDQSNSRQNRGLAWAWPPQKYREQGNSPLTVMLPPPPARRINVWPPESAQQVAPISSQRIQWPTQRGSKRFVWPPPNIQSNERTQTTDISRATTETSTTRAQITRIPSKLPANVWNPQSPQFVSRSQFLQTKRSTHRLTGDVVYNSNCTSLPPTYRPPPGSQHVDPGQIYPYGTQQVEPGHIYTRSTQDVKPGHIYTPGTQHVTPGHSHSYSSQHVDPVHRPPCSSTVDV